MVRYIDAEKALNSVDASVINSQYAISIIKSAPTEDVAPVVHAHWILYDDNNDIWDCSNCNEHIFINVLYGNRAKYCPKCGAKMDEAEIIGKRLIDGFIDGIGDNAKSVGQKFINNDKDTVEHTIMGMKNEVKDV